MATQTAITIESELNGLQDSSLREPESPERVPKDSPPAINQTATPFPTIAEEGTRLIPA
jgi:hypothetical protein